MRAARHISPGIGGRQIARQFGRSMHLHARQLLLRASVIRTHQRQSSGDGRQGNRVKARLVHQENVWLGWNGRQRDTTRAGNHATMIPLKIWADDCLQMLHRKRLKQCNSGPREHASAARSPHSGACTPCVNRRCRAI
ncbi:hypothetical protein SDC9_119987 [bioreactor metagenome]|uniref:Uncharacterized protein n=1 Tax=bioreactor metagenome TaxID=1076179 RepID=A0A645C7L6_9ZZZZ